MDRHGIERFLEFLLIGVMMGVVEDLIAIHFATDATFTPRLLIIVVLVAIPFAAFSELIVDHPGFLHIRRLASWIHRRIRRSS